MGAAVDEDRYGLPLSTDSASAASAYREGVDLMLSAWPGAAEAFERAIDADPDFGLPHAARARIHSFYQQGEAARKAAAAAREKVAHRGTHDWICASATRGIMARTSGFSPITAGR